MKINCLVIAACLSLIGCGEEFSETTSQTLSPSEPALAAIYDRSCRNCHTVAATGAPLTGDVATWEPRMELGLDVMLESVVSGSGGMPPFGLCMDCDADQFEQLIEFMATGK